MYKKISPVLAAAVIVAGVSACEAAPPTTSGQSAAAAAQVPVPENVPAACPAPGGGKLQVGLVVPNLQALFFNQVVTGVQTVADKAGVGLQVVSGNDDAVQQSSAVDNLVAKGVKAVIVDSIDTVGIKPALERAARGGVKVVAVDGIVDDPAVSAQVGTSNAESGKQMGDFLAGLAGDSGKVGVVGALNSTIQLQRQQGFVDEIKSKGMSEGPVADGKNVQETAQSAAENLLTGNPDLKYFYATGEPALIGLVAAVTNQNAKSHVNVVGWDLSDAEVNGLKAGFVKGVVQQNTFKFGYESMDAAIKLGCGQSVEKNIPVATQIVTPDNVDSYAYYLKK